MKHMGSKKGRRADGAKAGRGEVYIQGQLQELAIELNRLSSIRLSEDREGMRQRAVHRGRDSPRCPRRCGDVAGRTRRRCS